MKKEIIEEESAYRCKKYGTRLECKTCDGFGRNLDDSVDTEKCYVSFNKNKEYSITEENDLLSLSQ